MQNKGSQATDKVKGGGACTARSVGARVRKPKQSSKPSRGRAHAIAVLSSAGGGMESGGSSMQRTTKSSSRAVPAGQGASPIAALSDATLHALRPMHSPRTALCGRAEAGGYK